MTEKLVRDYMTPNPHSVRIDRSLTVAHGLMRKHKIRHLPVLDAGKLVGVLSLRDLHLIETLPDVDASDVKVEDAMTLDTYSVSPETPLAKVVRVMAKRKIGSAVVMSNGRPTGIFTTVDAMRTLATMLR